MLHNVTKTVILWHCENCETVFSCLILPHLKGAVTSCSRPFYLKTMAQKNNPRYKNGNFRRKMRARFKALGLPCHICGRPINYEEPSDHLHPLSFVIDEIHPVSRWKEFGYSSPEGACMDVDNLAPAHWICNQRKSNHLPTDQRRVERKVFISDGEW